MSLIRRLFDKEPEQRSGFPRGLPVWPDMPTKSGQVVTPESAARSAAVTACQRVLTTTVASLPVNAIRYDGATRVPVRPEPSVVRAPSGYVRRRVWVAQLMKSMLGNGNAYGQVVSASPRGFPTQVETLHYSAISWLTSNGMLKPHVNGKPHDLYPLGDIVHIAASPFVQPGTPVADSPVELAKQAIGTALAAEEFGARFFGDGYHPTAYAKSSADLTQDQADAIKARLNAMRRSREPGVFGADLDLHFPEINMEHTQFIELLRFEVEQACRFFGVPPSMVYAAVSGQSVTYANVSQADLQYLKHSVGIWLLDIEDAWTSMLPQPQVVKFNVDALLRMDAPERWKIHDLRLKNKSTTINDVKALEDEEPFQGDEYDEPGIPGGPDGSPLMTEEP